MPACTLLPPEFAPALIENGTVQTGLLANFLSGVFQRSLGRPGHIPYLQIFDTHESVVLADRGARFVQEVFSGVGDTGMNLLDSSFRLLPVAAEFNFAAHAPLVFGEALLVLLKAVE